MYFESFQEFIHMGGHGFYIWLCYAVVSIALIGYFIYSKSLATSNQKELINFYRRMDARVQNESGINATKSNLKSEEDK